MEADKIKTNILITGMILFLMILSITGCFENEKHLSESDRFVGEWKTEGGIEARFHSDGTCVFTGNEGTWQLKGDLLLITLPFTGGENTLGWSYNFTNNYNTLSLMNARDEGYIFYRQ